MSSVTGSVSILIPAYNANYFAQALASACAQRYTDLEIVVCDDSSGLEIGRATQAAGDARVRYVRNSHNLGFSGNFTRCLELANGEYIKYLNDDDLLHPDCVARMVAGFRRFGNRISLVTSKRRPIDHKGRQLNDIYATRGLAPGDALIEGPRAGNIMLTTCVNRIGEPTTTMFRRSDLESVGESIFKLGEHDYHCLADQSLWLRLLAKGDLLYLAAELSRFRLHSGQEQRKPHVRARCLKEHAWLLVDSMPLGYLSSSVAQTRAQRAVAGLIDFALVNDPDRVSGHEDELRSIRDLLSSG